MEIDHERYSGVLEQLRAALKICRKAVDTEVDRETVERLGGILEEIETTITMIEAEQGAVPLREG